MSPRTSALAILAVTTAFSYAAHAENWSSVSLLGQPSQILTPSDDELYPVPGKPPRYMGFGYRLASDEHTLAVTESFYNLAANFTEPIVVVTSEF